jgi:hypothetical protein
VVTGAELNCLNDRTRRAKMRSNAGPGRYRLDFEQCRR